MSQIEIKARQLRSEAAKRANRVGFLESLFSRESDRLEESMEYYTRAGNLFKLAKNWTQAAEAFVDAGDLGVRKKDYYEAASNYVEAAKCYKQCDALKAVDCYLKSIELYQDSGKFLMAAKYHQVIAKLYEDKYEIGEAIHHYERASDLFKLESNCSSAKKCSEKVAEYSALLRDYDKAIELFQEIACADLASSVMKYCAKQHLFRAAICLMCTEADVHHHLVRYVKAHPMFENSREYQFVLCLLECVEDDDEEGFTNAVRKFDSVSQLDQWHVTMLLRVKSRFREMKDLK